MSHANEYVTPEVRLPFVGRTHPQGRVAQQLSEGWCRRFGLSGLRDCVVATLCPGVPLHGLALVANWYSFFFTIDDQRVAECELVGSLRQVVADDSVSTAHDYQPVVLALRDLLRGTVPGCPAYWVMRLRGHLDRWLTGQLAESAYRLSGTVPTTDAYVSVRRDASAVLALLDLVEMVERAAVPDVLYRTPEYQTLVLGTADIVCWIDDLYSLDDGDPMNFVTVVDHHERQGTQHAIDAVAGRIAARVTDHVTASNALPTTMTQLGLEPVCRRAVMRCAADQQSWIAGTGTVQYGAAQAARLGRTAGLLEATL